MAAGDPRVDVVLGADVKAFASGMNAAMVSLRRFLTVGALASAAKHAIDFGSAMNDASKKANVSVGWLQEVGFAAGQAGSSFEELTNAVFELRRAQAQALGGSGSDTKAFAQLGITIEDLRRLNAEQIFDRIADAVHKTSGGIREVNAATAILGRGGKGLIAGMVEGFSEARETAQKFGLVLSEETIANMDSLGDRLDMLKLKLTALSAEILANASSWENWNGIWETGKNVVGTQWNISKALVSGLSPKAAWEEFKKGAARQSQIVDQTAEGMAAENQMLLGSRRKPTPGVEPVVLGGKGGATTDADQLARIGGFIGAHVGGLTVNLQRQQIRVLGQIHAAVREQTATLKTIA